MGVAFYFWMALGCGWFRTPPPDVVILSVDTLRVDHVSAYNVDSPSSTPNIDALARSSGATVFDTALTVSPLCTPSRFALLTGNYPTTAPNLAARKAPRWIHFNTYMDATSGRTSLPAQLAQRGYLSFFLGKFHLSEDKWSR